MASQPDGSSASKPQPGKPSSLAEWWRVYDGAVWASATLLIFIAGVVFRYFYIYKLHNPNDYVYSDMKMYVDLARRLNQPGYVPGIGDITHPPGNTWLLQYFMRSDPVKLTGLVRLNFIVASIVPLSMGFLGWVTYPGKKLVAGEVSGALNRALVWITRQRTAQASIILGSVYFPYIDFGGYYLAEIHMAFTGTMCIALYLLAMRLVHEPAEPGAPLRASSGFVAPLVDAFRQRPLHLIGAVVCMGIGGFIFSFAMALKMVAMLAIGGFMVTHFLFAKKPRWIFKLVLPAIFLIAAAPLTGTIVKRCTEANRDPITQKQTFCTGSNKSAADFLLGHRGRIQGIEWRDPKVPGVVGFGNPAAYQHGYREKAVVPFLITAQAENNKAAWDWVRKNKGEALVLSFEHVWDSFGGSYPWPPNATKIWPFSYTFHFLFLGFILFPSLVRLTDVLRERGVMGLLRSDEFVLLSPIFGVCAAVFLATGEVRYRIPWDPVFFVLAIEFYKKINYRFFEPAPAVVVPADAPAAQPAKAPPANAAPAKVEPADDAEEGAADERDDEAPESDEGAPAKPSKDGTDDRGDA